MTQPGYLQISHLLEGQTAAYLVVTADNLGWWEQLLGQPGELVPRTGLERALARALYRIGWLKPCNSGYSLTDEGRDIGFNRGFVRMITCGWEPTFRSLMAEAATADALPARTDAAAVARGCTDIARRHPETFVAIISPIATDPAPGKTLDLGCGDGGRLGALAQIAPKEQLAGVDIASDVITAAAARLERDGLGDRIDLRVGSVQPGPDAPSWLDSSLQRDVTTAMSFFLMHQLASDGDGITAVIRAWMDWFPNLRRLIITDVMRSDCIGWHEQPWFAPSFEFYHEITGVRVWRDEEYLSAFDELGWTVVKRYDNYDPAVVANVLER
jgi:SAM-dependent methyltransferase